MTEPHKVFYTYDQVHRGAVILRHKINKSGFSPDLIIGIARGGLYVSLVLSQTFKVSTLSINYSSKEGKGNDKHHIDNTQEVIRYVNDSTAPLNILLTDDIWDSGATITEIIKAFDRGGVLMKNNMKAATLFYRNLSTSPTIMKPDYYWTELTDSRWVCFPWEPIDG